MDDISASGKSSIIRNVTVADRRTSIRMEPAMWAALEEICLRENMTINQICSRIDRQRADSGLTAAVRLFILSYFRYLAHQREGAARSNATPVSRAFASVGA